MMYVLLFTAGVVVGAVATFVWLVKGMENIPPFR